MAKNVIRVGNVEILSLSDGMLEFDLCNFFPTIPEENWEAHASHLTDEHKVRFNLGSYLIRSGGRTILVDTSTDLRTQALANDVRRVDAILFTHSHADHIFGLDDVRRYNQMQQSAIPCFADADTLDNLKRMFGYVFNPATQKGGGISYEPLAYNITDPAHFSVSYAINPWMRPGEWMLDEAGHKQSARLAWDSLKAALVSAGFGYSPPKA